MSQPGSLTQLLLILQMAFIYLFRQKLLLIPARYPWCPVRVLLIKNVNSYRKFVLISRLYNKRSNAFPEAGTQSAEFQNILLATQKLPFIIITIIIRIKPLLQNTVITIKSNNIDLNAE